MRLFFISTSCFLISCSGKDFKQTPSGKIEYKIIYNSIRNNDFIKYGDAISYKRIKFYGDSILSSPYDSLPVIAYIDSQKIDPEYIDIFKKAHQGDSVIIRMPVDTLIKYQLDVPSYAKKGNYAGLRMKILEIIEDTLRAELLQNINVKKTVEIDEYIAEKQKIKDDRKLKNFFISKNITPIKTIKGVYIQFFKEGKGTTPQIGDSVSIIYSANTLAGEIFSSTYDSIRKAQKPFIFQVGDAAVIEGINDGIKLFKKRSVGRIFIPSYLAFGQKETPTVEANKCIYLDVELIDIIHKKN